MPNLLLNSVVHSASVQDILDNGKYLLLASVPTRFNVQNECTDLLRVYAHLKQGTGPSKKLSNITVIERYLQFTSICNYGLLVKRLQPLSNQVLFLTVYLLVSTSDYTILPSPSLEG